MQVVRVYNFMGIIHWSELYDHKFNHTQSESCIIDHYSRDVAISPWSLLLTSSCTGVECVARLMCKGYFMEHDWKTANIKCSPGRWTYMARKGSVKEMMQPCKSSRGNCCDDHSRSWRGKERTQTNSRIVSSHSLLAVSRQPKDKEKTARAAVACI